MKRSERIKFIGIRVKDSDLLVLCRIEALHGPAGWIAVGRILTMSVPLDTLLDSPFQEAFELALRARVAEQAARALEDEIPLF